MASPAEGWIELVKVVDVFDKMGVAYVLGGSMASSTFGPPRFTNDADIMASPFAGREEELAAQLSDEFYISVPAVKQANQRRGSFNLISLQMGFKVDVFIQKDRPYDASAMNRRIAAVTVENRAIAMLSPEDIVLTKLEWYRLGNEISDRQWSDIQGVLRARRDHLDVKYLQGWATELRVSDLLTRALEQAEIQ